MARSVDEPVRVLVADDNEMDRLLLSTFVRKEGYEVEPAVDGLDALEVFERCRPQLVLLDALMPGMDGFDVARHIKANSGEDFVPIIFLTSLTEADELARCVDAGGDDFLSKPYNKVILKAKLSALERMRSMHVTLQHQRDEIARHHAHLVQEQEAAKAVFDNVAHTGSLDLPFIRHLISPLAVFNGDVLLAARNPADDLYLLLGDFTGHGLTAAVGAMPLAEIFYGMSGKGFAPADILREANRKLRSILPQGYFCCAMLIACNFRKGTIEYWNGGLPPGCLLKRDSGALVHLESNHLPLGIVDNDRFDATTRVVETTVGDRLLICTDGVIEARNAEGEQFGFERLDELICATELEASVFETIRTGVYEHMGATGRDDDITLAEITVVSQDESESAVSAAVEPPEVGSDDWKLVYELGPRSLRSSNPLPLLQHVVMEVPQLRQHVGEIYTVLAELYSNSLEHGLMLLDSSLKSSPAGFASYYQARAEGLKRLKGKIRFEFSCNIDGRAGELIIHVVDTGPGFDYQAVLDRGNDQNTAYFGRGLRLLGELCQSLEYRGAGNEVQVVFAWCDDND